MTTKFITRRRLVGFTLLVFAFMPHVAARWHANRYNWTPLNFSTPLKRGEIRSPTFQADVDARYILSLELLPRRIDMDREDCLLGTRIFHPERCDSIPSVINVSWALYSQNRVVADDHTLQSWAALSVTNDWTRREIGRFDLNRGQQYYLLLRFHSDPTELNLAQPKLVAEAMQDWEGFALEVQFSLYLGVILSFVGLWLVIRRAVR